MAIFNSGDNVWNINFNEQDPVEYNARLAGALRIAKKIILDPKLYSEHKDDLLRIIESVEYATLVKTVENLGIDNCEEFPFDDYGIHRDEKLTEIISSIADRKHQI